MKAGEKRGRGRPKGSPNKSTLERAIKAERDLAAIQQAASNKERELAIDKLERLGKLCEGAASYFQPRSPEQLAQGIPENQNKNWGLFGEWVDRAIYCAKELANYQTPKLKAITVAAPAPELTETQKRKRFTLTIFEAPRPPQHLLRAPEEVDVDEVKH